MVQRTLWPALGLFLALSSGIAQAAVDLVTLPTREGTQLTIYNSEDITMVREHRLLTVKEGVNRIQFSWANTLIDPTSIEFRILDQQDKVDLVDTTFPAGRNEALQWNIKSQIAGKIPVEIRYFTSGITWAADYVGVANEDETKLNVTGYVRVFNNSGELYDNAQTRMVVGNINLVEKIADLARRPPPGRPVPTGATAAPPPETKPGAAAKGEAFSDAVQQAEQLAAKPEAPKEVIKQGLSEYFLFTIDGREDIKDKEPKRLIALKAAEVPLECLYKLTDRDGDTQQFTKFYRFKNIKLLDEKGKEKKLSAMENLGLSPLPNGMVRLFSEYANKDLAYVGGTQTKYVPIGDRVEVNVGADKDITIHRRLKDQQTTNVVVRQYKRRLDDNFVLYYDLTDFDETFYFEEELVSGKPVDAKVELERKFDANVVLWEPDGQPKDWDSKTEGAYVDLHGIPGRVERVDQGHVKYFLDLKPGKKQLVTYKVTYKRRKQGPELNAEREAGAVVMEPSNIANRSGLPKHENTERTNSMRIILTIAFAGTLLLAAIPAQARIKLTTLPERESVRIDIQNGRYTLVEEERTVNLQAGRNQVDFSWANINIDKDSIVFRVIKADGEVNVLNTNYPPNENALYWTVSAEKAGPAVIRISYLIGNMAAEPSYQGVVENDEKNLLLQVYMTVTNTSGESFGETIVQPGVGKTTVRYFNDGERKRMLAAKFAEVPIAKRYVFDATVDQQKTRMYYRLTNDKENQMGGFPLPYGKMRLFIKEPKSDGDTVRSRTFLGEDWAQYTPLFAALDLYVGVAQDVKVERFTMDPEGGVRNAFDEIVVPRFTIDGKEGVTKPQFRNLRTRYRYRLQNFKTEKGDPITVPLTIKEHLDGEWIIEKVVLKEILGERNEQKEKEIPYAELFNTKRIDVSNAEFEMKLPPTTIDKKYDLYVTILKKYRRY